MMKMRYTLLLLFTSAIGFANVSLDNPIVTVVDKTVEVTAVTDATGVLSISCSPKRASKGNKKEATGIALVQFPFKADGSQGVSFEVMGDGSDHYASVFVSKSKELLNEGYEATFALKNKEWNTVTLRWEDFTQNIKPWSDSGRVDASTISMAPDAMQQLGFGRGFSYHKYYTQKWGFKIRNLRLLDKMLSPKEVSVHAPYSRLKSVIAEKGCLNILMVGDSITDLGGDRSQGFYMAQKLAAKYGITFKVVNSAIAGHSARNGRIVLPRSVRMLPAPDMVIVMYGANDCKSTGLGLTEEVFSLQMSALIQSIRREVQSEPDIILLSGVPRLKKEGRLESEGSVEAIAKGIEDAAIRENTAYCDSLNAYLRMDPKNRVSYYLDTIHQNDKGLQWIGEVLFATITKAMDKRIDADE